MLGSTFPVLSRLFAFPAIVWIPRLFLSFDCAGTMHITMANSQLTNAAITSTGKHCKHRNSAKADPKTFLSHMTELKNRVVLRFSLRCCDITKPYMCRHNYDASLQYARLFSPFFRSYIAMSRFRVKAILEAIVCSQTIDENARCTTPVR